MGEYIVLRNGLLWADGFASEELAIDYIKECIRQDEFFLDEQNEYKVLPSDEVDDEEDDSWDEDRLFCGCCSCCGCSCYDSDDDWEDE